MKQIWILFAVLSVLNIAPAAWAKSHAGIVTMEADLTAHQGKEVRLWLPYPVSDADQSIEAVKVSGDFAESAVYTDRTNGTPILYARWGSEAKSRKLIFTFSARRDEVLRRPIPPAAPWDPADYRHYLAATSLGPIDGEVRALADKITRGKTTVAEKAKAIYDWTCDNMYRDPDTRGCGKGDVCALLKKPGGKCTDISSTFVALARAAGVPAREIFGLRLGRKDDEDITSHQHCWAEFFLPGYGWMAVDPADVRKAMLVEKLGPEDPKTARYRDYFWGNLDPYRIRIAVGRDLVLNPPQAGPPLNTFGYPYAEVDGKPVDFYDPKGFAYRIVYRDR